MQYLKQIVTALNTAIAAKFTDERFQGSEYNGIAISAINETSEPPQLMPVLTDHFDDERWVGIDDTFPIRIYHKNNGISYRTAPIAKQFGDGNKAKVETANMCMIIYGNRAKIKMTPEELEGAIHSGFPSVISSSTLEDLKLSSCLIEFISSIFDPVAVYLQEYRTDKFELSPNALLLRINYTIASTYKTACFNLCDCEAATVESPHL